MQKISIVTGTLNRKEYLPALLNNTIRADQRLELVLVDGGSTDGTIEMMEYISSVEPRLKFIQVGQRSPYPHYMNLGIKNASHEIVCQWNDDILLIDEPVGRWPKNWQKVFDQIDDEHDAYLFNWKEGYVSEIDDESWLKCSSMRDNGWIIINNADHDYEQKENEKYGEIVMNYGIYKKDVFREYGMYHPNYKYYCADGEMAMRAYYKGCKFKCLVDVKVCSIPCEKRAIMLHEDCKRYQVACKNYVNGKFEQGYEYLK